MKGLSFYLPGDMSKGVIIRAAVSYKDQLSQAYTKTVLQLENGALPEDIIIVSLSTDPDNLYDYETGIMVEGKTKDDFIAAEVITTACSLAIARKF